MRVCVTEHVDQLPLGRPSVRANATVLATDDPTAAENFIVYLNNEHSDEDNPLNAFLAVKEHVRDVQWLSESVVLCATGVGNLQLFSNGRDAVIQQVASVQQVHSAYIREVAVQAGNDPTVATGGK